MAENDELLQAVLDQPEEDGPRLAYAAHCDEHGDPRGAFIRAQCQLTAMRRRQHLDDDLFVPAHELEKQLLTKHGKEWSSSVQRLVTAALFYRGFVELVVLDARKFLRLAPELYRRTPVLHLFLANAAPVIDELFASPHLGRILSLNLEKSRIGDKGAKALAASPHLHKLRWLNLNDNEIGQEGIEAICASQHLPMLKYLAFKRNRVPDPTSKPGAIDGQFGQILEWDIPPQGRELMKRFGPKPWLQYETKESYFWPPSVDAV